MVNIHFSNDKQKHFYWKMSTFNIFLFPWFEMDIWFEKINRLVTEKHCFDLVLKIWHSLHIIKNIKYLNAMSCHTKWQFLSWHSWKMATNRDLPKLANYHKTATPSTFFQWVTTLYFRLQQPHLSLTHEKIATKNGAVQIICKG